MIYRDKVLEVIHKKLNVKKYTLEEFNPLLGGMRAIDKKGNIFIFYYDWLTDSVHVFDPLE